MNDSNDPSNPTNTRATLRLKVAPRKAAPAAKPTAQAQAPSKANLKPGARWSDEYRQSMQADMDSLVSR